MQLLTIPTESGYALFLMSYCLLFAGVLLLAACRAGETDLTPQPREITTASGLKYVDLAPGSGPAAAPGRTVAVHYTGWLANGSKFDSSLDRGQPFEFPLGGRRVIRGWDEGVAGMRIGGKRKLIIPPELGYGARGMPPVIPPNSILIFEVELLEIK